MVDVIRLLGHVSNRAARHIEGGHHPAAVRQVGRGGTAASRGVERRINLAAAEVFPSAFPPTRQDVREILAETAGKRLVVLMAGNEVGVVAQSGD